MSDNCDSIEPKNRTKYAYDAGGSNGLGRLTSITYHTAISMVYVTDTTTENYKYTAAGQVSQKKVTIGRCVDNYFSCAYASPLSLNYTYDSEGHRLTMNTPSRNFNYTYDQMERASGMTDAGTGTALVSGITYGPSNETLQISYGDLYQNQYKGVTETRTYNSFLQLTNLVSSGQLGASPVNVNRTYAYSATQNNGRIGSTTNNVSGEQVVYQYDSLNRLIQAQNGSVWGQGFVYDGFGNLYQKNVLAGSVPTMNLNVDATTNRLITTGSSHFTYDNNGNMLSGPTVANTYDFLNRVVSSIPSGSTQGYYGYDGSNRRIYKMTVDVHQNRTEAYYLYGTGGENLGTYTPTYVVSPASLTLTLAQSRVYFFSKKLWGTEDNVGSVTSAGSYYPFGEDKGSSPPPNEQYKFATYWRDGESGLDYAKNRYYSSTLGRFLSADPSRRSGGLKNPQSWNRYAYVENDPVNFFDPAGLDECPAGEVCVVEGGSGGDSGYQDGGGAGGSQDPSPAWMAMNWLDMYPDSNKLWNKDMTLLQGGMNFLQWTMQNLPEPCQQDLNDLSNSDLTGSSVQVSAQAIVDQSKSVALVDAQGNTNRAIGLFVPGSSDYINQLAAGANQTIQSYVSGTTTAATALPGSPLYGATGAIFFAPGTLSHKTTNADVAALLMHELIHTLGLDDTQIQSALFGPESPLVKQASENITTKIEEDCF